MTGLYHLWITVDNFLVFYANKNKKSTNSTKNAIARSMLIKIPVAMTMSEPAAVFSAIISFPFIINSAISIPTKRPTNPPNGGKKINPRINPRNPNSSPFFDAPLYLAPIMPEK